MTLVAVANALSVLVVRQYGAPLLPAMPALPTFRQSALHAGKMLTCLAPAPNTLSVGQREPVGHAHVYANSGIAPGQCRLLNIVCQVDEKPASTQRYGQGLRDAFRQSQSLVKPHLGQAFDTDGAITIARPEHRDIYIGKFDGVPAPAGLEARVARCRSVTRPTIELPSRPVSAT